MKAPFDHAVKRHAATVLRVCSAVLGPGPDAEDAWSETFLAALRAWPDLEDGTNVEAWLVRVAQRKAIDIVRARARRPVPHGDAVGVPERTDLPGGERSEEVADIWSAVADLPQRQRLAVAYHFIGGLRHAETAELIGGSPESVRRASADGIKRLRSVLVGARPEPSTRCRDDDSKKGNGDA